MDSQGAPDSDTQALSIVIAAAPAGSQYEQASSDTQSTTTSTSWQTKTSVTFTPTTAQDWLIFGFAEYKGSRSSYSAMVPVTVDGAAVSSVINEANDATDYRSFTTVKVSNLTAAAHTIALQYRSENSGATTYIRNARVVAIPKGSLEMFSAASDATTALTNTMTDRATLGWTPATAGEYLLVWSAEVSASTGYSTLVEARYGGAAWDSATVESKDNTDYFPFTSFAVADCTATAQTITLAAAREGGTTTQNIRNARLAAVRLTGGRFAGMQSVSSDSEATTTSTTFQEKLTKTWTVGTTGNWLLLSSARVNGTNASYSVEARFQLDDATVLGQPLLEPNDTTDYMNVGCMAVRSLSAGSRRFDVDYRSENASATAKIRTARFVALPLD